MDEEKEQNNLVKEAGEKLKQGAKKQAKDAMKQVFKKVIVAIAPILLKFLIILIIAIIVIEAAAWILRLFSSKNSKEASTSAIEYSYVDSMYSSEEPKTPKGYKMQVTIDSKNGYYKLNYLFYNDKGEQIDEETAINAVKEKLLTHGLDVGEFSESELKMLAVLEHNKLELDQYSEEELKCLILFHKAEIAGLNFDLRKGEDIGKEVNVEEVLENDFIYGTLQATRTRVINTNEGTKYDTTQLEYLEYGNSETEGTFAYLIEHNNRDEAIKYFSIDEKGNLVVARWNTSTTTVAYTGANGEALSVEQIPEKNRVSGESVVNVLAKPIAYKDQIKGYILRYGLLSDLLLTTQSPEFSADLCKLAFNSKIVINIKEELSHTETNTLNTYTDTILTRKHVKYNVTGENVSVSNNWKTEKSGTGEPTSNPNTVGHGWNPSTSLKYSGGTMRTYEWTYNNKQYRLTVLEGQSATTWNLQVNNTRENSTSVNLGQQNDLTVDGELIDNGNIDNRHYTAIEKFTYNVDVHTTTDTNYYDVEASEIDCWLTKLKVKYEDPLEPQSSNGGDSNEFTGDYSEEEKGDAIVDQTIINQDTHVQAFKTKKENEYKSKADRNVNCNVTQLRIGTIIKEDMKYNYSYSTTRYKFGKEVANTTEIKLKNVTYVDDKPKFTNKDENDEDEIGFLYIYDKYMQDGEDLFLKQDAENWLFDMLQKSNQTEVYSDIMKYVLYAYDGIDRGVTQLDLSIFKLPKFTTNSSFGLSCITSTKFSKEEFVDAVQNYSAAISRGSGTQVFRDNAEVIYDVCLANNINPVLCAAQAWKEQCWVAPGTSPFNYWGIAVYNGQNYGEKYPNMEAAVARYCNQINSQMNGSLRDLYQKQAEEYATVNSHFTGRMINMYDIFSAYVGTTEPTLEERAEHMVRYVDDIIQCANQIFGEGALYSGAGELLEYAKMIHDYMSDPEHLYYYCLLGGSKYEYVHRGEGLSCGLASNFAQSQQPGSYGYRLTCCATYVSWVLEEAGYIQNHNNECNALKRELERNGWTQVDSYSELEPGDIVFMDTDGANNGNITHVQIFVGDDCWYDAGSNNSIHKVEPYQDNSYAPPRFVAALRQP